MEDDALLMGVWNFWPHTLQLRFPNMLCLSLACQRAVDARGGGGEAYTLTVTDFSWWQNRHLNVVAAC
jgi:hypothetical protein